MKATLLPDTAMRRAKYTRYADESASSVTRTYGTAKIAAARPVAIAIMTRLPPMTTPSM